MIWSVPAAIKWIRGLEHFDLQYVEQPVPDFDVQGLAQVRRSVARPDRRRRGVHRPALRARADQGGRLRRVRRLPVRGGRADAGAPDRGARRRRRQVVRDRQLGRARRRDDRRTPISSPRPRTSRSRATRTTRCRSSTCSREPFEMTDGLVEVPRRAGARGRARSGGRATARQHSGPRVRLL